MTHMISALRSQPPRELDDDLGHEAHPEAGHDDAFEERRAALPCGRAADHVETHAVDDRVAEHVHGIGKKSGRMRDHAGAHPGKEHHEVDPEDHLDDSPLASLYRPNRATRVHSPTLRQSQGLLQRVSRDSSTTFALSLRATAEASVTVVPQVDRSTPAC